jgi:molybdate transport system substrate-binding protein
MKKWIVLFVIGICIAISGNCFAADLIVFSGAGLMKPMEEFRSNFEQMHGITVDVHYGSSGEIFGQLAAKQPCDVLIPGAAKYTNDALKNGWVEADTITPLVYHIPLIIVPQGNPGDIHALEDLVKLGIKLAIGDPKAPAIGRVSIQIFEKNSIIDAVTPNVQVYAPTVNQLLIYVALKQVDAALIWGDMVTWAEGKGKVEVIRINPEQNIIKTIPTAVTTNAPHKKRARQFNDYISSEEGLSIWTKWGFEPCKK